MNYFGYSKCARASQVDLVDSRFGLIIALIFTYLGLECHGAVLSVTDLLRIQKCSQPYVGENLIISVSYLSTESTLEVRVYNCLRQHYCILTSLVAVIIPLVVV